MKPPPFRYHAPDSLAEALTLAAQLGDDAMLLAGGQSLVPMLNLRMARPSEIIDLNRVAELAYLRAEKGVLAIGAMTRHVTVEQSPAMAETAPLLSEAMPFVGYQAIRSRGTIGGSIANADPKAELPCVAVAAAAEVVLKSQHDSRVVEAEQFFLGPYTTARRPDEILTEIRVPIVSDGTVTAFVEFARSDGEFAIALVAVWLQFDDRHCTSARISVAGATAMPVRARHAEAALDGRVVDAESITDAVAAVGDDTQPINDIHGSADYRRRLTRVLVRRALDRAAARVIEPSTFDGWPK